MSIYEMKPEYIIDIGGMSMVANICSSYISTIAIGLCPSELTHTTENYQIVSKTLSPSEKNMLTSLGFDESSVVEGLLDTDGEFVRILDECRKRELSH
jgi:hypothetical protein